jgi:hypothetical protein
MGQTHPHRSETLLLLPTGDRDKISFKKEDIYNMFYKQSPSLFTSSAAGCFFLLKRKLLPWLYSKSG